MTSQNRDEPAHHTLPFRVDVGEKFELNVLSTDQDLEECRRFLRGVSAHKVDSVRIGQLGSYEVLLTRGADNWDVDVCVCAIIDHDGGSKEQCVRVRLLRSDLLKAFTASLSPAVEGQSNLHSQPPLPKEIQEAVGESHILRGAADALDTMRYVATHWKIPHISVRISTFAELDRQRTQSRITYLAEAGEYQSLGAVAAVATIIVGTISVTRKYINRSMEERFVDTYVTSTRLWEYAVGLAVATACAWMAGRILGALWCRVRLLLFLFRVWYRARFQEQAG